MSEIPSALRYTKDHEWVKLEGDTALIGITEFAQSELGEIVFVELPDIASQISKGDSFCVVESTKAASDVYCPIEGEVLEVNSELENAPDLVNTSPFENGWLVKLKGVSADSLEGLMTPEEYSKHINA
ncbi:UNVERIFIED_CONTAM: hypothetical protein GTU68_053384 [Idotea baltica]|nr:hypothetical protein [Idotea baltica]